MYTVQIFFLVDGVQDSAITTLSSFKMCDKFITLFFEAMDTILELKFAQNISLQSLSIEQS